uniref:Uncharacterized protein n=1 Tax=Anguilla anguilla TaxID=7936 RepID=A0A0E9S3J1_ANGAN
MPETKRHVKKGSAMSISCEIITNRQQTIT